MMRDRREVLGLTQVAAAKAAGIVRRTWGEIELGHRRGSDDTLTRIAEVLELPPNSLRALNAPSTENLAPLRRELVEMVRQMNTREELEQALLDVTRARAEALQGRLQSYRDAVAHDRPIEVRPPSTA